MVKVREIYGCPPLKYERFMVKAREIEVVSY